MSPIGQNRQQAPLKLKGVLLWVMIATVAFHAAYAGAATSWLILVYLFALLQLARAEKWRGAFYGGLAVGLLIAAGRLDFFWNIFSGGAMALWLVYAFWTGLFVALARLCIRGTHSNWGWPFVPFAWTGLEYFRSELYYLRFSWLNPGYAFAGVSGLVPLNVLGVYGVGFLCMAVVCLAALFWQNGRRRWLAVTVPVSLVVAVCLLTAGRAGSKPSDSTIRIAGVQLEFPTESEVLLRLSELLRQHPDTELVVLSEYTFIEPIPEKIKRWCLQHKRHLIVGGKEPTATSNFYNTAFVIGPEGCIVFKQIKAVPIQFFNDGLPAPEQNVWNSPWGRIGICICYDLSYTRVTDRLVKHGAQAMIVPTMDMMDWGGRQHQLHAHVAPVRAAEYGIPIFRVASSGISQWVDGTGRMEASAPCPGDGAILFGTLELRGAGRLPLDRWLAPFSTAVTALISVLFLIRAVVGPRTSDFGLRTSPEMPNPSS